MGFLVLLELEMRNRLLPHLAPRRLDEFGRAALKLEPSVREWEPAVALFAGPEGLDDYRILLRQLPKLLTENGVAIFEIGATQAEQVADIAAKSGFASELRRDLAGRPRALVLRLGLGK